MNLTNFKNDTKSRKPHYLLLGHPVEHSWSPLMHNTALKHYNMEAEYFAIDLENNELAELAAFFNRDTFLGANITIPYKQIITDFLDDVDRPAQEMGAVNTIVKQHYHLKGYNTDYKGFVSPLENFAGLIEGMGAIVFGTGGASRAIVVGLVKMGIERIYLVSRTPDRISSFDEFELVQLISYDQWTTFSSESMLIVNATPLGMYPNIDKSPIRESEKNFLEDRICYDIVYNPLETKFLKQAEEVGATTINGLEMLIQQGSRSFELWTGRTFPLEIIRNTLYERIAN
jgi:shikimate dehydrogenase